LTALVLTSQKYWGQKKYWGGLKVEITDETIGFSQLLGARVWAAPQKSTPMISSMLNLPV